MSSIERKKESRSNVFDRQVIVVYYNGGTVMLQDKKKHLGADRLAAI